MSKKTENVIPKVIIVFSFLGMVAVLWMFISNSSYIVRMQNGEDVARQQLATARIDLKKAKSNQTNQMFGFSSTGQMDDEVLKEVKVNNKGFTLLNTIDPMQGDDAAVKKAIKQKKTPYDENMKKALSEYFQDNKMLDKAFPKNGAQTVQAYQLRREPTGVDVYSTNVPHQYQVIVRYNKSESMKGNMPLQDIYKVKVDETKKQSISVVEFGQGFDVKVG